MNTIQIVNNMKEDKYLLLEKTVDNLNDVIGLGDVRLSRIDGNGVDVEANGLITIMGVEFLAVAVGHLDKNNVLQAISKALGLKKRSGKPVLLLCDKANPQICKALMDKGISVMDVAGNCLVRYRKVFVAIQGRKSVETSLRPGKAFNETGVKLVYYLLQSSGNVSSSYRTMHDKTGVSLGAIKNILEDLKNSRMVATTKSKRMIIDRNGLLARWAEAYARALKPQLLMGRMAFTADALDKWQTIELPENACWGGESGAYMRDGYLQPENFTIYTDGSIRELMQTGCLVPSPKGNIEVCSRFWDCEKNDKIAPLIVVYADLMGSGDSRCLEAAERIKAHGL